jgi:hypothetical protein
MSLDLSCPGGRLFLAASGLISAYAANSGSLLWTNELKGMSYEPICLRALDTINTQPTWTRVTSGDSHQDYILENQQKTR